MNRAVMMGLATVVLAGVAVQGVYAGKPAARISVKEKLEKDRDSSKDEKENSSTRTKTETQKYDLSITVSYTVQEQTDLDLEWYFLCRPLSASGDKGKAAVCEKGKTTLSVKGMSRKMHPVTSKELSWKEVKTSKSSKGNNSNSSDTGGKSFSGSVFEGYVVLVRVNGEIIAKHSNEKKFLTDEWIENLHEAPVVNGSAKTTTQRKRRKKKK